MQILEFAYVRLNFLLERYDVIRDIISGMKERPGYKNESSVFPKWSLLFHVPLFNGGRADRSRNANLFLLEAEPTDLGTPICSYRRQSRRV